MKQAVVGKRPDDRLITREDGKPIKDFRKRWHKIVNKAGLAGMIIHDFRRSAVRNLVHAGVPEKVP